MSVIPGWRLAAIACSTVARRARRTHLLTGDRGSTPDRAVRSGHLGLSCGCPARCGRSRNQPGVRPVCLEERSGEAAPCATRTTSFQGLPYRLQPCHSPQGGMGDGPTCLTRDTTPPLQSCGRPTATSDTSATSTTRCAISALSRRVCLSGRACRWRSIRHAGASVSCARVIPHPSSLTRTRCRPARRCIAGAGT